MTIDVGDWLSNSTASQQQAEPCGLFVPASGDAPRVPVPLRRRDVSATVYADACFADTKETLSYISDVDCTAVFRFPLPPRAAVYSLYGTRRRKPPPLRFVALAALFFVRDLPAGREVAFNVTCFGSNHKSLFPACRPYDADSEREALSWIQKHVAADMGGTEILATLQHIYSSPLSPGFTREVVFLTDGGISGHEEQAVYDLVHRTRPSPPSSSSRSPSSPYPAAASTAASAAALRTRVLSLGIGHGVHRSLLEGMAARSDGAVVYVVDEEAIAAKTAFLKRAALAVGAGLRPRLVARGALVRAAPHVLPQRVFAGEPLHVLLEVCECEPDATLELTAEYGSGAGEGAGEGQAAGAEAVATATLTLSLPLGAAAGPGAAVPEGRALGVLHAMTYIGSLLSGTSPLHLRPDGTAMPRPSADVVRDTVVQLAVSEHLVTPYTSAVGVALRRDPVDPAAARNVVEVPLQQYPAGRKLWGTADPPANDECDTSYFAARCAAAPPPRMMPMMAAAAPVNFAAAPMPRMARALAAAPPPPSGAPGGFVLFGSSGGGGPMVMKGAAACAPAAAPADLFAASSATEAFTRAGFQMKRGSGGAAGFGAAVMNGIATVFGGGAARQAAAAPPPPSAPAAMPEAGAKEEEEEELHEYEDECCGAADWSEDEEQTASRSYWRASPALAAALGLPLGLLVAAGAPAAADGVADGAADADAKVTAAAAALRPAGLCDDGWATVVVLARLRGWLADQRAVWADMEAKAVAWLGGVWPQGGRSVGSTVLALAKALPAA
ncbi:hypothetical protein GPECTOR_33g597 [Gonium pectorale]|uniref:VWFA domain-containing protein n=1 Tax=Gonium pectorale TaxID=33097 RepID=A0A150GDP8_GONPE|nr:hypothetical protein GPECTOR_33g597 [Gonium pectorale]|eukprot:KXZ47715.1 hypothetical protein GPECTOR_33g597 [Gonium pectorale]